MKLTRTQRLIRIVEILHAGRKCGVGMLADEFGVSRRSILRDMNVLRDAGLDCHYDADSESYMLEKSFHLRPVDLSLDEGLALLMLTRKVVSDRVLPAYKSMVSAALKVEASVPDEVREHCGPMLEHIDFQWSQISDVDPVSDLIVRIERAIVARRKVHLRYDSYYDKKEIALVLRPFRVFFRRRGWYVVGHSERHREVRLFKLERIVDMEETDRAFRMDNNFTLRGYFGNAWNMIRGDERHHVEVVFGAQVAGNIEEVMWHPTQRTRRRSDGTLVFEADVDGVDEIAWWILGYGDQAVVVEPECLRAKVAKHAERMVKHYKRNATSPAG